jgi:hypothetical protein
MLNRLAAVLIVAFWVVMWGLLLKSELEPEEGVLREVPVEHVLKLMFHHQQSSDLIIHNDGKMIGHLRLGPRILENGGRQLDFTGGLQLRMPAADRQRLSWIGESTFSSELDLQKLTLDVTMHGSSGDTPDSRLSFEFDSAEKKGRYELRSGTMIFDKQEFEATEAGIRKLVDRLGMDASFTQTMAGSKSSAPPQVKARRASFKLRDEEIDTLLLTVVYNEQTMLQVHVSQLGRVLHAKTILGWTLESD